MRWVKNLDGVKVPIMSWCENVEDGAMEQAINVAKLPFAVHHLALMADCHQGYALPIGGVLAVKDVVLPYCVGVDIGCGMGAVQTDIHWETISLDQINTIVNLIHDRIPVGEGYHHNIPQTDWDGWKDFIARITDIPGWMPMENGYPGRVWKLAQMNLGTLGGGK